MLPSAAVALFPFVASAAVTVAAHQALDQTMVAAGSLRAQVDADVGPLSPRPCSLPMWRRCPGWRRSSAMVHHQGSEAVATLAERQAVVRLEQAALARLAFVAMVAGRGLQPTLTPQRLHGRLRHFRGFREPR